MALDSELIRRQFPFLNPKDGPAPIYLDSASTAQKPQAVIDALLAGYAHGTANPHRSMYPLAEQATDAYEHARSTVQAFIGAQYADEIIFTRNTTEAINLVAKSWARTNLKKGDHIVLTILEHHSNIVPWQQLAHEHGVILDWIDIDDDGNLRMDELQDVLQNERVKLVAITGQSNVTGTRPPLHEIILHAHNAGALVLVDAAQLIGHTTVNVQELNCDFLAFSGHKLYGPSGIGVLYAKRDILRTMPPFLGGGMMIRSVTTDGFEPTDAPARFEAGSMPVADAVGLAAAVTWLSQYSMDDRTTHEQTLITHAIDQLSSIDGLRILGQPQQKIQSTNQPINQSIVSGCISFAIDGVHAHDLTHMLGEKGFCLRAGHHCAQPLHDRLGITASTRLSVALYNTTHEIDLLIPAMQESINILKK